MTPAIDVHTHMLNRDWLELLRAHGRPRYEVRASLDAPEGLWVLRLGEKRVAGGDADLGVHALVAAGIGLTVELEAMRTLGLRPPMWSRCAWDRSTCSILSCSAKPSVDVTEPASSRTVPSSRRPGRCRPGADPPWQPRTVSFMANTLAGRGVKAR